MKEESDKNSTAEIIPFPSRLRPPADAAGRLDRAVRALAEANAELQENLLGWRRVSDALAVSLGEITEKLKALDTTLKSASSLLQNSREDDAD